MGVPPAESRLTERVRVRLPEHVPQPLEVYLNGVLQEHGRDYQLEGRALVFDRPLAREGRLGFWRWLSMFLGIAGTYRRNDTVDVVYEAEGRRSVATALPFESA
jgi:hypothetical protein